MVALLACAQPSGPRPEAQIRQFQQGGYATPAAELATTSAASAWIEAGTGSRIDVKVIAPADAARHPVVLYLPGLGQSTDDGALWCAKWASAGYVVIVVQAEADGRSVWQTPDARYGEFRNVAQAHFAPDALRRRIVATRFAVAEAARRGASGDVLLSRGDFSRIAIAGFDLGAQTALAMGVAASSTPALRGIIALSPYETLARPSPEEDWSRVSLPALVVTGSQDADPYGLIVQATLRQAVFEHLPAGGKLELLLHAGRHDTLAGNVPGTGSASGRDASDRASRGGEGEGRTGSSGSRRGGRGTQRREGDAPGTTADAPGTDGAVRPAGGNAAERASRMSLREMAAVQSVTTAFLDGVLADDALAREWLGRDAARYLRDMGTLRSK